MAFRVRDATRAWQQGPILMSIRSPAIDRALVITAMIVTCPPAGDLPPRAKIVGQYDPHDPLKSLAYDGIDHRRCARRRL